MKVFLKALHGLGAAFLALGLILAGLPGDWPGSVPVGAAEIPQNINWPISPDDHCVAYRTVKGMFFFFTSEIVGINCHISTEISRDATGDHFQLTLSIPVKYFDSGNDNRDRHVGEILGGKSQLPVLFLSEWLSKAQVEKILEEKKGLVSGTLVIGNKESPLAFDVRVTVRGKSTLVRAMAGTTFAAMGVSVPKVGPAGAIAAPGEALVLMGQFQWAKLIGAEGISISK